MSNIQSLKRRIKSAKNIKQITKAMEMVAASKMRKAQSQALASRPYARKLQSTLNTIARQSKETSHPLLIDHGQGREVVMLVSTDKSLAGSLNTNLFRATQQKVDELELVDPLFIIVGSKASRFVRSAGFELFAEFTNIPDPVTYKDALPIAAMIMDGFEEYRFKKVHIIYMDFVSTLVQRARHTQLLPLDTNWTEIQENLDNTLDEIIDSSASYVFEPSAENILNWLLPYYIEMYTFQILLEAKASEHSARMVSMKNASENAGEIIDDLTLSFNKARQASITAELLDNTTAALNVKH